MMHKQFSKGFTLLEVLVVVSIIGLLSSIVFSSISTSRVKSRDTLRITQIREVQNALDLYYAVNGVYPDNTTALTAPEVPHNWSSMLSSLNSGNFIKATFLDNKKSEGFLANFDFIKTAYAVIGFPFYPSSIQDPLYKAGADYPYSYGYTAYNSGKTYKIRLYLENPSNSLFSSSLQGVFLDASVLGATACDKTAPFYYYCTGPLP